MENKNPSGIHWGFCFIACQPALATANAVQEPGDRTLTLGLDDHDAVAHVVTVADADYAYVVAVADADYAYVVVVIRCEGELGESYVAVVGCTEGGVIVTERVAVAEAVVGHADVTVAESRSSVDGGGGDWSRVANRGGGDWSYIGLAVADTHRGYTGRGSVRNCGCDCRGGYGDRRGISHGDGDRNRIGEGCDVVTITVVAETDVANSDHVVTTETDVANSDHVVAPSNDNITATDNDTVASFCGATANRKSGQGSHASE